MGWTITFQVVRDHALRPAERTALRAHVRRFKALDGYGFAVAPAAAPGGVIASGGGKLARTPDPDEDENAARLFAALTELRTIVTGATIEIADDLHLVGWDGDSVTLVRDPDQELTPEPTDRTGWEQIPTARRPRKVATPKPAPTPLSVLKLPPELAAALAAILAGTLPQLPPFTDENAQVAADAVLTAIAIAHKQKEPDRATRDALEVLARALPPSSVVRAGLASKRHVSGAAASAIHDALARLPDLVEVRDRIMELWLGPAPERKPEHYWDHLSAYLLRPAMHDPVVVASLGDDLDQAVLDDRVLIRRHFDGQRRLSEVRDGVLRLIRRRRRDRQRSDVRSSNHLVDEIASKAFPEALPTVLLELAHQPDRDDLLLMLARFDDPRVLPILERALATDQYTRQVTMGLLLVAGDRAEQLLEQLLAHVDPLVRIRAAQGLVARRGPVAVPLLVASIAHARAAGIWRYQYPPGKWSSEQLRCPEDGLGFPSVLRRSWRDLDAVSLDVPDPLVESSSTTARMRSANPDVRRDAIELAHEAARAARDASAILPLVYAERLHRVLCDHAGLPQTTRRGSCSRVRITNYWSDPAWRKLARIPFDPSYKYDSVTWKWLDAHAAELSPQSIPPELADVPTQEAALAAAAAAPDRRLRFTAEEVACWDEEERRNAEA